MSDILRATNGIDLSKDIQFNILYLPRYGIKR